MIQLVHELPQRMRLSVPQLKGDGRGVVSFRARLHMVDGVTEADLNPLTGSLLVHHDGRPETRERILRKLGEFVRAAAPQRTGSLPPSAIAVAPARLDDRIAEMVAEALAEHLAKRLVRMAVAALI